MKNQPFFSRSVEKLRPILQLRPYRLFLHPLSIWLLLYWNPIVRCLKSQLIIPNVLTPSHNPLKVAHVIAQKMLPWMIAGTSLHNPCVLIISPLATFTSRIYETSTENWRTSIKAASMKLWKLLESRRIIKDTILTLPSTLIVPGKGLPTKA